MAKKLKNKKKINKQQSTYLKNLSALKNKYPEIAKRVEKTVVRNYKLEKTGKYNLANILDLNTNTYYYDKDNPSIDAQKQVDSLKLKNTRIALFLGLGLGYELFYYAKNHSKTQKTNFMIIMEKDIEIFKIALEVSDLTFFIENKNTLFLIEAPEEDLFLTFKNLLSSNNKVFTLIKTMKPVYHISALKNNKSYYLNAVKKLKEAGVYQLKWVGNDPNDQLIGLDNILDNLNEIIYNPGINLLFNKFKNKPAVIVSTGPSLNKNKHLLKGLEDKALIIAPDASLKILMDMGVKPHMVTSLERVEKTAELLEGYTEEEVKDVYFAGTPVVKKKCYDVFPAPRIIVYRSLGYFKWLGIDRGILEIQASAGNMAFKVAEAMGCNPIILIGQDLALSRDGYSHAEGAVLGEKQNNYYKNLIEVMGNDGKPIMTSPTLQLFLQGYEVDIAGFKGKCINATEGGAYIKGTEIMTFQEAIKKYTSDEIYPLQNIKENLEVFSHKQSMEDLKNLEIIINNTKMEIENIMKKSKENLELIDINKEHLKELIKKGEPINNNDQEKTNKTLKKIFEFKSSMNTYDIKFRQFFMHTIQSFLLNFEVQMATIPDKYDDESLAKTELILHHLRYFNVIHETAKISIDMLNKAKEKIANN